MISQHRKDIDLLQSPEEGTKMIRGMEDLSCKDRQWELGLFSVEKRRHWVDAAVPEGAYQQDGERLFMRTCGDGIKRNGFKLKESGLRLDIKQKFLYCEGDETCNRLPREGVGAPSLSVFKTRLAEALRELFKGYPAHGRGSWK